jgi:uncharacterized protein YceH (UPF0502 family)
VKLPLEALHARILGVLAEKQATVPDAYPLSLNALVAGIEQKTARWPVMEGVAPSAVLAAIDDLKRGAWVVEVSGARVVRYDHNLPRVLGVPGAAAALLVVLMLRGPQTPAELRQNSERLHRFADVSSVEGFLEELAAKAVPLARRLPRAPGEREARWVHLLCGEPPEGATAAAATAARRGDAEDTAALAALREELAALRERVARLERELGLGGA